MAFSQAVRHFIYNALPARLKSCSVTKSVLETDFFKRSKSSAEKPTEPAILAVSSGPPLLTNGPGGRQDANAYSFSTGGTGSLRTSQ